MSDELYAKLTSKLQGRFCMYLRKSRADMEAENRGEGETLARHERNLFDLAKRLKINISEVFREIVSGETISQRPVIQDVLRQVEEGLWDGVLVMEIERLARGDTIDQGIIAQTFKYAGTKIITPVKTYDPDNEFDEEYFEFGLFMSRREYKTINRRQQTGRRDSVSEGKFIGNIAPYGYNRLKLTNEKGWTLEPHPEQGPIIKMIYDMYVNQGQGTGLIAKKLNAMAIPTMKNSQWTVATINGIIRNPVYYGVIAWRRRPEKKTRKNGVLQRSRPRVESSEWLVAEGKHEALVTKDTWDRAQEIMKGRTHTPAPAGVITNPLAGIIRCGVCGRLMVRRPYKNNQPASMMCQGPTCKNISSPLYLVEERILDGLRIWLEHYKAQWESNKPVQATENETTLHTKMLIVKDLEKKLHELHEQNNNLHDLLEKKIYTVETYLERSQTLGQRINEAEESIRAAMMEMELEKKRQSAKVDIIPNVEYVLDTYPKSDDPAQQNKLLKSVLEIAVYTKTEKGHWAKPENIHKFDLKLFPKLPRA
ncbi:recombinase family protein [Paenibacillus barcinonensis]|uniref:recombinase family protein n=1 Tax=Paenibacillus barcinonensis TaxID=198119 RepID=UPI001C0F40A6|nr:recombinase family protein [Paenibacillus barcinonensis]MBU5356089.1 recombinase family protein [Paenibacillus barcinonensis]